jgi:2-polyprenyl-3-methyl-5-hydroxy-6-metoxy-1,4-benzoquinol methylase
MPSSDPGLRCRLCTAPLSHPVWDLGAAPLANAYRRPDDPVSEQYYPLRLHLCERCALVQLEAVASPEIIFADYAYFSSYSNTLLRHSERFADAAIERVGLKPGDLVVEVASNDGYLLQYFKARGIEVFGVEPAASVAEAAIARGLPTATRFFGAQTAQDLVSQGLRPRLIAANNVVAHVPDPNDFICGLKTLLAPR